MTPHEWDTTANMDALFAAIRGRVSDRKMMLFACGCCRLVEGDIPGAALLAKQFEPKADRPMKAEEKVSLLTTAFQFVFGDQQSYLARMLGGADQSPWLLAYRVANLLRYFQAVKGHKPGEEGGEPTQPELSSDSPEQAAVLRDIVGHPFRDVGFDPNWRTETVVGLANAIEEDAAWDRMPILADALQDAGCERSEVLAHCRDPHQIHRRGCWVIDAILGRS
ncbi:hypothetical protein [Limnoglobus roseus]|uniref:SMI1/KNR4 family protein n=1 Tax=Limnoglobus roseus TaxID=2598579 RepID=A0A5C1AFT6_9BACT|nr:hypothetical protein [Limnoglobus roseus]QEL16602.1 hypothetical protein PX52LOC_03562 [Limnoglobus roseus]